MLASTFRPVRMHSALALIILLHAAFALPLPFYGPHTVASFDGSIPAPLSPQTDIHNKEGGDFWNKLRLIYGGYYDTSYGFCPKANGFETFTPAGGVSCKRSAMVGPELVDEVVNVDWDAVKPQVEESTADTVPDASIDDVHHPVHDAPVDAVPAAENGLDKRERPDGFYETWMKPDWYMKNKYKKFGDLSINGGYHAYLLDLSPEFRNVYLEYSKARVEEPEQEKVDHSFVNWPEGQ